MDENQAPFSSLFQRLELFQRIRTPVTPEESVRNRLLQHLVEALSYPPHLILVEKSLRSFLHAAGCLNSVAHNKRRLDVLVISPAHRTSSKLDVWHPQPLLLIECKAQTINQKALNQALCYNQSLAAPCISIVCEQTQNTGFLHPTTKTLHFYPGIPTFSQLIAYNQWFEENSKSCARKDKTNPPSLKQSPKVFTE